MFFGPIRFPAALLGTATLIVLSQPQLAAALSAAEVSKTAKEIVVLIEGQGAPGSGTIISRQGNRYSVLTAKHVVANINAGEEGYITTHDGQRYRFTSAAIQKLPGVDLATIEFRSDRSYAIAQMGNSNRATEGTLVYVAGFPLPTAAINRSIYNFTEGKIIANASQPLEDGYALVYSNATLSGMSGGPVLNDRGEIVGIHGRADTLGSQASPNNPDVRVKTGFNLGIPLQPFLHLLPRLEGENEIEPISPPPVDTRADDLYLQGLKHFERENWQTAITVFNQAIRLDPDLAPAYGNRGIARAELGNFSAAIKDYNQVIRLVPDDDKAYYNRGVAHSALGNYDAAVQDYTRSIRLNSGDADSYYNRGNALVALEKYRRAVDDYTAALKLDPRDAGIYNNRGAALRRLEDYRGAISDYDRAVRLNPDYAEAYFNRGIAHYYLRDVEDAIADFKRAAKLFREQGDSKGYQQAIKNVNVLEN